MVDRTDVEVVVRGAVYALGDVVGLLVVSHQNRTAFVVNVVLAYAFDSVASRTWCAADSQKLR